MKHFNSVFSMDPKKIWNLTKFFLAALLIVGLINKIDFSNIKNILHVLWFWLVLNLLVLFGMTLIKAWQYQKMIGNSIGYKEVLRVVIWQNAISNFVSTSAGILSYMAMLKTEQNVKLTRSSVAFVITKFGDLVAICIYLGLSTIFVWRKIQSIQWLTILLIVGILFGLTLFLITVLWRERFVEFLASVLGLLRMHRFSLSQRGLEMLRSLAREEQKPIFAMLYTGVSLSFVYMTATMVFAYTRFRIFDVHVELWTILYVTAMMQLVSFIPIQVLGGLGVSEVTSVYLFSLFGFDKGEMSAVMLGLRVLFYLMNTVLLLYLPIDTLFLTKKRVS